MDAKNALHAGAGARVCGFALPLLLSAVWRWAKACAQHRRQRLVLAELDDRLLRDVGLTRADMVREADKYPWVR